MITLTQHINHTVSYTKKKTFKRNFPIHLFPMFTIFLHQTHTSLRSDTHLKLLQANAQQTHSFPKRTTFIPLNYSQFSDSKQHGVVAVYVVAQEALRSITLLSIPTRVEWIIITQMGERAMWCCTTIHAVENVLSDELEN